MVSVGTEYDSARMDRHVTRSQETETTAERIAAGEAVDALMEHPGFEVLEAAFEEARTKVLALLLSHKPTADAAAYADKAGEMRGLSRFRSIAEVKVKQGRKAEEELRQLEEQGNG